MRRASVAGACLLAIAGVVAAQDKPAAQKPPSGQVGGLHFVDTSEITIVTVDVSVRDKNGVVLNLKPESFEVYHDGKLQEIANFSAFVRTQPTPAPAVSATAVPTAAPTPTLAPPAPPSEPRFLVVYVDNENIMPFNRNRVLTRLNDFLRNNLRPPDKVMVVSYQRSMKVIQSPTSDVEDAVDALRTLRTYTGGRSDVNSDRKQLEEYINDNAEQANTLENAEGRARAFAREQKNSLTFTVRTIQELVTMLAGVPGRKSIIYVSDGLPMSPGLEVFYEIQDRYRDPSAVSQAAEFESTTLFRSLVTSAAAAGVTFYTIDARGLESELGMEAENRQARSTLSAAIARSNYQDSLVYMAEQTGGTAIINTNDVAVGLEAIATNLETFYSLGYRLIPSGQDRLHRVEVRVKGHPEYRLNYRRSFIEKSLPSRVGDQVVSGLVFDPESNVLGIEALAGEPSPSSGGRWALPVEIRLPIDKLAMVLDGEELAGYVVAYYAARDDEGKQSDLQRVEHAVRIPSAEYGKAKGQYYTLTASLLLEPGNYRLSVGVRDQLTNQAGFDVVRKGVALETLR